MTADVLIPVGVAVVAILAAVAALTIAWRRSSGEAPARPEWRRRVDSEAVAADRTPRPSVGPPPQVPEPTDSEPAATPESVEEPDSLPDGEPHPDSEPEAQPVGVSVATVQRTVEITPEEAGVTRRMFFNRALGYIFLGAFGGTLSLSFLSFLWPRLEGGFGTDVVAGSVSALSNEAVNDDGSVTPVFIPEARAYIVPAPATLSEQYAGVGVEAGGLMALYQRCVHLGCRVPWCQTSQGFECPCHGSKYNGIGEYFSGPAPRNLDRFAVEVNAQNQLVIITSSIIETPRAPSRSVAYPQGVSCIGGV